LAAGAGRTQTASTLGRFGGGGGLTWSEDRAATALADPALAGKGALHRRFRQRRLGVQGRRPPRATERGVLDFGVQRDLGYSRRLVQRLHHRSPFFKVRFSSDRATAEWPPLRNGLPYDALGSDDSARFQSDTQDAGP